MTAAPQRHDPLEDLAALPDPQERLAWIAERGRQPPPLAAHERTEDRRVPGCVSRVWIVDESRGGFCRFRGDAEAPVLRGLVALVCSRADGRAAQDVATDATDVIAALKLERHLTPTRVNGVRQLQAHLRRAAAKHAEAQDRASNRAP